MALIDGTYSRVWQKGGPIVEFRKYHVSHTLLISHLHGLYKMNILACIR